MRKFAAVTALVAGVMFGGGAFAAAHQYDFTATPFQPFGTLGGANFTITYTPPGAELTYNDGADAPGPINGAIFTLAGDGDGLGINDDEITEFGISGQSITLTFDKTMRISGLAFLDLFLSSDGLDVETALVSVDGGAPISFFGNQAIGPAPNYGTGFAEFGGLNLRGSIFTFTADSTNDSVGRGDFALAAIQGTVVPLPASVLLLGGALGGLGLMRRRRRA